MAREVFGPEPNTASRLSRETLFDFFCAAAKEFDTNLRRKLESINHPRFSVRHNERQLSMNVQELILTTTLFRKFKGREIKHVHPCSVLRYEVCTLRRLRNLVGADTSLLKRNSAGDFSVLTPVCCVSEDHDDGEGHKMCVGEIVVPLTGGQDGSVRVFCPSKHCAPIALAGTLKRAPRDIGKVEVKKGERFLMLTLFEDLPCLADSVKVQDDLVIRGYQFTVTRVQTVVEDRVLMIDIDRPCPFTAGESRPSPARVMQIVHARGYHATLPLMKLRVFKPARFAFKKSSESLNVAIHSLCFNGGGYITVRKFLGEEETAQLAALQL